MQPISYHHHPPLSFHTHDPKIVVNKNSVQEGLPCGKARVCKGHLHATSSIIMYIQQPNFTLALIYTSCHTPAYVRTHVYKKDERHYRNAELTDFSSSSRSDTRSIEEKCRLELAGKKNGEGPTGPQSHSLISMAHKDSHHLTFTISLRVFKFTYLPLPAIRPLIFEHTSTEYYSKF